MPLIGRPGGFDQGSAKRLAAQVRLGERNAINGREQRQRHTYGQPGDVKRRHAVLDGNLIYGAEAVASVWSAKNAASMVDTNENLTVRTWMLEAGQMLEEASHVVIEQFEDGRWYVVNSRECAVDQ